MQMPNCLLFWQASIISPLASLILHIKCACTSLLHCVCVCTYSYLAQEYLGKYGEERDFNKLPVSYPPVSETIHVYCSVHGVFTCTMYNDDLYLLLS